MPQQLVLLALSPVYCQDSWYGVSRTSPHLAHERSGGANTSNCGGSGHSLTDSSSRELENHRENESRLQQRSSEHPIKRSAPTTPIAHCRPYRLSFRSKIASNALKFLRRAPTTTRMASTSARVATGSWCREILHSVNLCACSRLFMKACFALHGNCFPRSDRQVSERHGILLVSGGHRQELC